MPSDRKPPVPPSLPPLNELKKLVGAKGDGSHDLCAPAVCALLGIGPLIDQPPDWPAWQLPSPALPIDKCIDDFLHRRRAPAVSDARRADRAWCPFYSARLHTARSVERACHEDAAWHLRGEATETFRRLAEMATKADKSLQDLADELSDPNLSFVWLPWRTRREEGLDIAQAESMVKKAFAVARRQMEDRLAAVAALSSLALDGVTKFQRRDDDEAIWKHSFVYRIGQLWHELFGKKPPRSHDQADLFTKLLDASLASVSTTVLSWPQAKNAAHRRHQNADAGFGFDAFSPDIDLAKERALKAALGHLRVGTKH